MQRISHLFSGSVGEVFWELSLQNQNITHVKILKSMTFQSLGYKAGDGFTPKYLTVLEVDLRDNWYSHKLMKDN